MSSDLSTKNLKASFIEVDKASIAKIEATIISLDEELVIVDEYDEITTSIKPHRTQTRNLSVTESFSVNAGATVSIPSAIWNTTSYSVDFILISEDIKEKSAIFVTGITTITLPPSCEFDINGAIYLLTVFNIGSDVVTIHCDAGYNHGGKFDFAITTKTNAKFGLCGGGEDGTPPGIFIL